MTTMLMGYGTAAASLLMFAAACTQKDSTHLQPIVSGGTGGSSSDAGASGSAGDAGSAGAPGGLGGSGGSIDAGVPDAGSAQFRAVLQGDTVSLTPLEQIWLRICEGPPQLVQRSSGAWTLLRDDRPDAPNLQHDAHYLDGAYHSDCALSAGCDVGSCELYTGSEDAPEGNYSPLVAREHVQVGESEAPTCDRRDAGSEVDASGDAGTRLVPDIESRPPEGLLGVRIRYHRDSDCQTEAITTHVVVE